MRSLLDQMLVADPKNRISIANLKNHAWYQGGVDHNNHHSSPAGIPATPTEAQLEAAVQPVQKGGQGNELNNNGEDVFKDDEFEDFDTNTSTGPVKLNAFDVVSHCGGFMIDKMFSPEIFYKVPTDDVSSPAKSYSNLGGSILFGSTGSKSKSYQFTASNTSAIDLSREVCNALEAILFTIEGNKERSIQSGIIKANRVTAKGMVGITIQVFILSPTLSLLTIRKGKGDLLEWNNAYSELVEKRIAHLINKAKSPDADVKEYY